MRQSRTSPAVVAGEARIQSSSSLLGGGRQGGQAELGSRMGQMVQELSKTPVEEGRHIGASVESALHDPAFVETASRWRGGNYSRQVASVLAKVAKYLRIVKPEILEASSTCELQPVQPLPLVPVGAASNWRTWAQGHMSRMSLSLSSNRSKAVGFGVAMMILLYPRVVAAVLVLLLRLCLRALGLVMGRLVAELWTEIRSCMWTALQSSWILEDNLVAWLEGSWPPVQQLPAPAPVMAGSPSPPSMSEPTVITGEYSPPPPALLSSSCALTFLWWWLHRRPQRTGRVGN